MERPISNSMRPKCSSVERPTRLVRVDDKPSFRQWCAEMLLNPKQVSALLRISLTMVYRYLDLGQNTPVREGTALVCNLISEKDPYLRMQWVQEQLIATGCPEPWPANNPISLPEPE